MREQALKFLDALGGPENIVEIEGCITRLRGTVVDPGKMDVAKLKELQIRGEPIVKGKVVQVVVGTYAEMIATEMNKIMRSR
jgi:glucose-like phosphotransferase system IIB component